MQPTSLSVLVKHITESTMHTDRDPAVSQQAERPARLQWKPDEPRLFLSFFSYQSIVDLG